MPPRGLAVDQFGAKGRVGRVRAAADRLLFRFLDDLRLGSVFARVRALFSGRLPRFSNDFTSQVETGPRLAFESQEFRRKGISLDQHGS